MLFCSSSIFLAGMRAFLLTSFMTRSCSFSERLLELGRQMPRQKRSLRDGAAKAFAMSVEGLKMHWFPDGTGLDVRSIERASISLIS